MGVADEGLGIALVAFHVKTVVVGSTEWFHGRAFGPWTMVMVLGWWSCVDGEGDDGQRRWWWWWWWMVVSMRVTVMTKERNRINTSLGDGDTKPPRTSASLRKTRAVMGSAQSPNQTGPPRKVNQHQNKTKKQVPKRWVEPGSKHRYSGLNCKENRPTYSHCTTTGCEHSVPLIYVQCYSDVVGKAPWYTYILWLPFLPSQG